MKTYIGTKVIKAEPCKVWKEMGKHAIGEDGYRVVYPDGYISWSPKDVFEKAYHELTHDMTFGQALDALKTGQKVSRHNWNGKGQYIELAVRISYIDHNGNEINVGHNTMGNKAIAFVGNQGVQLGWLASQADMLSDDWYIVE
ncbi:MAG: DUF2829 domain-containing protein [Megasphaera sp.]|jgi:hypothetical protein|uniref:DUF2829 domain-containing protein n=1 Tax=Megasphaera sp. TaxID=2023260 RepID=UPI003F126F6F